MTSTVRVRSVEMHVFDHEAVTDAIRASGDFYEAAILDDVRRRRVPCDAILDVGAHMGNHSLYWSTFVEHSLLIALEPVPESYELLRQNLAGFPNALALPLAASDAPGLVRLKRDTVNMGRSRIDEDGDVQAVAVRLDDLGLRPSFVKVDVEGHQAQVLAGARATLAAWHPSLLIEDEERVVADTLAGMGLSGYRKTREYGGWNDLWEWA